MTSTLNWFDMETETMDPVTRGSGVHWSGFTGDALKMAKLLAKSKFTEEVAKSIVGYGLDVV